MKRYSVQKSVGKGSFGSALLCKRRKDGRACIIKQVSTSKLTPRQRAEALKEASLLASLRHPNIVCYWESFFEEGGYRGAPSHLCIVMEFADGGDLFQYLKRRKSSYIPEERVLNWLVQITLALKHIHDRKILHRDLKTQNIFLTSSNVVKLGDFGIAKVLSHTLEHAMTAIGTPYYMAPEICQEKRYNNKADMWSLGCVAYEMLALKHAFDGSNMRQLAMKICRGQPTSLPSYASPEIKSLVMQLLSKNPSLRPSANALLRHKLVKDRIASFLTELQVQDEFSHTVLHGKVHVLKPHAGGGHARSSHPSGRSSPSQPRAAALQLHGMVPAGSKASRPVLQIKPGPVMGRIGQPRPAVKKAGAGIGIGARAGARAGNRGGVEGVGQLQGIRAAGVQQIRSQLQKEGKAKANANVVRPKADVGAKLGARVQARVRAEVKARLNGNAKPDRAAQIMKDGGQGKSPVSDSKARLHHAPRQRKAAQAHAYIEPVVAAAAARRRGSDQSSEVSEGSRRGSVLSDDGNKAGVRDRGIAPAGKVQGNAKVTASPHVKASKNGAGTPGGHAPASQRDPITPAPASTPASAPAVSSVTPQKCATPIKLRNIPASGGVVAPAKEESEGLSEGAASAFHEIKQPGVQEKQQLRGASPIQHNPSVQLSPRVDTAWLANLELQMGAIQSKVHVLKTPPKEEAAEKKKPGVMVRVEEAEAAADLLMRESNRDPSPVKEVVGSEAPDASDAPAPELVPKGRGRDRSGSGSGSGSGNRVPMGKMLRSSSFSDAKPKAKVQVPGIKAGAVQSVTPQRKSRRKVIHPSSARKADPPSSRKAKVSVRRRKSDGGGRTAVSQNQNGSPVDRVAALKEARDRDRAELKALIAARRKEKAAGGAGSQGSSSAGVAVLATRRPSCGENNKAPLGSPSSFASSAKNSISAQSKRARQHGNGRRQESVTNSTNSTSSTSRHRDDKEKPRESATGSRHEERRKELLAVIAEGRKANMLMQQDCTEVRAVASLNRHVPPPPPATNLEPPTSPIEAMEQSNPSAELAVEGKDGRGNRDDRDGKDAELSGAEDRDDEGEQDEGVIKGENKRPVTEAGLPSVEAEGSTGEAEAQAAADVNIAAVQAPADALSAPTESEAEAEAEVTRAEEEGAGIQAGSGADSCQEAPTAVEVAVTIAVAEAEAEGQRPVVIAPNAVAELQQVTGMASHSDSDGDELMPSLHGSLLQIRGTADREEEESAAMEQAPQLEAHDVTFEGELVESIGDEASFAASQEYRAMVHNMMDILLQSPGSGTSSDTISSAGSIDATNEASVMGGGSSRECYSVAAGGAEGREMNDPADSFVSMYRQLRTLIAASGGAEPTAELIKNVIGSEASAAVGADLSTPALLSAMHKLIEIEESHLVELGEGL